MTFDEITASLSMREWAIVEAKAGQGMGALGDASAPKALLFTAMVWVLKKREDPNYSFKDAEALSLSAINEALGLNDEEDDEEAPKD